MVPADVGQRMTLATTASTITTPAMPRISGSLLLERSGTGGSGQLRAVRRRTRRFGVEVVVHQRRPVCGERRLPGERLEEQAAQRVDVHSAVHLVAGE
jgi:hypothetical protein